MQANTALAELRAEGDEVQDRAPEPIQSRDLECVAVAKQLEQLVELWAARLGAAGAVDVDRVLSDASPQECVDLVVGVLVSGRDARVAEDHTVESTPRAS